MALRSGFAMNRVSQGPACRVVGHVPTRPTPSTRPARLLGNRTNATRAPQHAGLAAEALTHLEDRVPLAVGGTVSASRTTTGTRTADTRLRIRANGHAMIWKPTSVIANENVSVTGGIEIEIETMILGMRKGPRLVVEICLLRAWRKTTRRAGIGDRSARIMRTGTAMDRCPRFAMTVPWIRMIRPRGRAGLDGSVICWWDGCSVFGHCAQRCVIFAVVFLP